MLHTIHNQSPASLSRTCVTERDFSILLIRMKFDWEKNESMKSLWRWCGKKLIACVIGTRTHFSWLMIIQRCFRGFPYINVNHRNDISFFCVFWTWVLHFWSLFMLLGITDQVSLLRFDAIWKYAFVMQTIFCPTF